MAGPERSLQDDLQAIMEWLRGLPQAAVTGARELPGAVVQQGVGLGESVRGLPEQFQHDPVEGTRQLAMLAMLLGPLFGGLSRGVRGSQSGGASRLGSQTGAVTPAPPETPLWHKEGPNATVLRRPNLVAPMEENWVTDPAQKSLLYLGAPRQPGGIPWVENASTAPTAVRQGSMSNLLLRSLRQAGGEAMLGAPGLAPEMATEEMQGVLRGLEAAGLITRRTLPASGKNVAALTQSGLEFPFSEGSSGP